jgi:hypothetical protein
MRLTQYSQGMGLRESVQASVSAIADPQDQAAIDLALTYAADIDGGVADLAKVGPALLTVLEALGLTPRARKAVKSDGQQPASPLDQLAAARARRGRPEAVDAAAP